MMSLTQLATELSWGTFNVTEIKIIGFHDPENLRFDQNVKHSVFIYPNETVRIVSIFDSVMMTTNNRRPFSIRHFAALRW